MPNPLHPDRMTAAERLAEIGRILALGYLRARNRKRDGKPGDIKALGEVSLDFTAAESGHGGNENHSRESR